MNSSDSEQKEMKAEIWTGKFLKAFFQAELGSLKRVSLYGTSYSGPYSEMKNQDDAIQKGTGTKN